MLRRRRKSHGTMVPSSEADKSSSRQGGGLSAVPGLWGTYPLVLVERFQTSNSVEVTAGRLDGPLAWSRPRQKKSKTAPHLSADAAPFAATPSPWECRPSRNSIGKNLTRMVSRKALESVYARMPSRNFSSHLLQRLPRQAVAMEMTGVLWCDWGRPQRIVDTLQRIGKHSPFPVEHAVAV